MTCVLHITSDISGEIRQFNDTTWAKVKSAASDKRKFRQESKYFSIIYITACGGGNMHGMYLFLAG